VSGSFALIKAAQQRRPTRWRRDAQIIMTPCMGIGTVLGFCGRNRVEAGLESGLNASNRPERLQRLAQNPTAGQPVA